MTSSQFSVAVLISGGGTTLRNLIEKIELEKLDFEIRLVISSRSDAAGIEFAREAEIPVEVVEHAEFDKVEAFSDKIFQLCDAADIDLVVMGGFLKHVLIPADFEKRVINIHPSLIPKYCGKGFYGIRVHRAVLENSETKTGCTVHIVDDEYDHGPIVAQRVVDVLPDDNPEQLARRVFEAECELLPEIIQTIAKSATASLNEK